jgi:carbon-monoxide dehydrogenase medium subunit
MAVGSYRLKGGIMSDMRIAIGGAEAAPRRMTEAERTLIGRPPNLGTFQAAAHIAVKAIDPLDDASVSADYRREIARAMVVRALEAASA